MGCIFSKPATLPELLSKILQPRFPNDIIDIICLYIPRDEYKLIWSYPIRKEWWHPNSHLVSIYEASSDHGHGRGNPRHPCFLLIMDPIPKRLFLSSYEPVNWVLIGPFAWSVTSIYLLGYGGDDLPHTVSCWSCACFTTIHDYQRNSINDKRLEPPDKYAHDRWTNPKYFKYDLLLKDWDGSSGECDQLMQNVRSIFKATGCITWTAQTRYNASFLCVHWCWLIVYVVGIILYYSL